MTNATQTGSHSSALVALVRTEALANHLRDWCAQAGLDPCRIIVSSTPTDAINDTDWSGTRIAIIEGGIPDGPTLACIEDVIDRTPPDASVIALLDTPASSDIRRLFRAGVSDVLPGPADPSEVRSALDAAILRAGNIGKPVEHEGRLYTLLKSAGGVGATSMAINLARELTHLNAGRVAVIDMDVQFGNVDVALDLSSRMNLTDAIRAGTRLDATMLHSMMTRHSSGLDTLPGGKTIAPADVLTPAFVEAFCRQIKRTHDHVFLDMPMSWTTWFQAAIDASDLVIPVVEPSVRCAHGSLRIVQALQDLGSSNVHLFPIANKIDRVPAARERLRQIGEIMSTSLDVSVRDDQKTAQVSADKGECWRDTSAVAPLTQDIEAAAHKLLTIVNPTAVPARQPAVGRFSFFGGRS